MSESISLELLNTKLDKLLSITNTNKNILDVHTQKLADTNQRLASINERLELIEKRLASIEPFIPVDNSKLVYATNTNHVAAS